MSLRHSPRRFIESLECRTHLNAYFLEAGTGSYYEGSSAMFQIMISDEDRTFTDVWINWDDGTPIDHYPAGDPHFEDPNSTYLVLDVEHGFPDNSPAWPGNHIEVTVRDSSSGDSTGSFDWAECENAAPYATLQSAFDESTNSFTASLLNATDWSPVDLSAGLRYRFATSYNELHAVNWSQRYSTASTSNSASFEFTTPGPHEVWAQVIDKDGGYRDYCTTITVPDLAAMTLSASQNSLTWQDIKPNSTGYRIQRSLDGQNFSIYRNLTRTELTFSNGLIAWTDENLQENQRAWYRVRATDDMGSGNETAYSPKKDATTRLAAPADVLASVNESSGDLRVNWTNQSQAADQVIVSWAFVPPTGPATASAVTLPGNAQDYTFDNTDLGKTYDVAVMAVNDVGNTSTTADGSSDVEPTNDWTSVYDLYMTPPTPSYVSHVWNRGVDGAPHPVTGMPISMPAPDYGEEMVTLMLNGLPRHTWVHVEMRLDASGIFDEENPSQLTATASGVGMNVGASRYQYEEYWSAGIDAFQHTDSSLTITLEMTSFPQTATWTPGLVWVTTYLPHVWLEGSGMAIEDGTGDGKFFANRHDPGNNTINATGLNVETIDAGGTAIEGVDYYKVGTIQIPGGQNIGDKPVTLIDDPDAEGIEEIKQQVVPTKEYAILLGAPPGAAAVQDNVSINPQNGVTVVMATAAQLGGQIPNQANTVDGFRVYFLILVKGERLDQVQTRQDIWCQTKIWDFQGTLVDNPTALQVVRTATGDPNAPDTLVNSPNNTFHPDPMGGWGAWANLSLPPNSDNATAYAIDEHTLGLGAFGQDPDMYTYIASVTRSMRLTFRNQITQAILTEKDWGFTWTNEPARWTVNPPVPVCAKLSGNQGKGKFIPGPLVIKLEQMN